MEGQSSNHASQSSFRGAIPIKTWVKLWTIVTVMLGALALRLVAPAFSLGSQQIQYLRTSTTTTTSTTSPYDFIRMLAENDTMADEGVSDCCSTCPVTNENEWLEVIPFAVQILLIGLLIAGSALFSGLTLGLMSLDKTGLEIVMGGDDPSNAAYAKRIYPVREDGNLLLCTLLLGNVTVNSFLSILMSAYAGGAIGLLTSTFLIVIFGEIVPQALCSRYALYIGSATIPLVKVIRCAMYPVAAPLAWCLDKSLGRELVSTYSSAEMLKLLQIHLQENIIDQETAGAMTGALTYKNFAVKDVMTTLDRVYMLNVDEKLSFETIAMIFKTGFSRIPVYEVSVNNVIGLLFVKDLIFVDPEDDTPIRSFIQIFGRGVHVVWPDDKLGEVLTELKKGRSHLALVRDVNNEDETQDPFYEIKGIITLEDIIEKIIGDKIVDETDAFIDNTQSMKVDRQESFEWARLRLLDAKIVDEMLSFEEAKAVTAHLRMNHNDAVKLLTDAQLERLVSETPVTKLSKATREVGKDLPDDLLYQKGQPTDVCTLILSGRVTIFVGSDNFRSEVSSWSLLGMAALADPSYKADFTAYVSDAPCRCLHFSYTRFSDAVDASTLERHLQVDSKMATAVLNSPPPASEGSIRSEPANGVLHSDAVHVGDHKNRREKLIAALQVFKKTGSNSSLEKAQSDPVNQVPRPSTVHFQEGPKAGSRKEKFSGSDNADQERSEVGKPGALVDVSNNAEQETSQNEDSSVKSA